MILPHYFFNYCCEENCSYYSNDGHYLINKVKKSNYHSLNIDCVANILSYKIKILLCQDWNNYFTKLHFWQLNFLVDPNTNEVRLILLIFRSWQSVHFSKFPYRALLFLLSILHSHSFLHLTTILYIQSQRAIRILHYH